jgi:hypothetical protein
MLCGQHEPSSIEQELPSHPNRAWTNERNSLHPLTTRRSTPALQRAHCFHGTVMCGRSGPGRPSFSQAADDCLCLPAWFGEEPGGYSPFQPHRKGAWPTSDRGFARHCRRPNIPASIRQGLAADGLAPPDDVPVPLASADTIGAIEVFAFDEVPNDRKGSREVTYWSDVPPATKDYVAARDAIVRHIEEAMTSLGKR